MDSLRLALYRLITGRLTHRDQELLQQWAKENEEREKLLDKFSEADYISLQIERRNMVNVSRPMADMQRRIHEIRRRKYVHVFSIAALVAIIIGFATKFYINPIEETTKGYVSHVNRPNSIEEITPGKTIAHLTSTSGTSIPLTAADTMSVLPETLVMGNMSAIPQKDQLLSLDVPRGGEFKVMLEDSTEVWLNSESTLSYPEAFGPKERRVRVTGEAYFAVTHDENRPFYVETQGQTIRVYGTSFNVRAYDDDPFIYTTLEEGSISITRSDIPSGEIKLLPGHQALLSLEDRKLALRAVDPKVITGWRHGRFVFEEQPLSTIMRDLSRWYNFDYEFTSPQIADIVFMGSIPRYADFVTAISIIEKSGGIKFTTHEGKVIISAYE